MAERDLHTEEARGAGGDGLSASGDPEADRPASDRARHRSFARIVGYILGGLIGFVVLAVVVIVLLLQTGWGARQAKELILPVVNNTLQGAHLEIDEIDGTFLTSLRLYDVSLVTDEGERLAHVDTLRASYRLLPLLQRQLYIRDAYIANPQVWMEQRADSTWDLLSILPQDTTQQQQQPLAIRLDEFVLNDGQATVSFYAPEGDSTLYAENLNVRLSGLRTGEELAVGLDSLWGRYTLPGASDMVQVSAGARLANQQLTVRGLQLTSPYSRVRSEGTLRLPNAEGAPLHNIDFTLTADPFALRDIHPFAPTLNPEATVTIDAQVQGTSQLLEADVEARTGQGGVLTLNGQLTPTTDGPIEYRAAVEARQLTPDYFTDGSTDAPIQLNADAQVDLSGPALDALNGTARLRVFDTDLGAQQVREATLQSTFNEGRTRFNLQGQLQGATLTAEGAGRFFDEVPTYQAEGQFENVQLGVLLNNPQLESQLRGRFDIEGQGTDPETADVEASLVLTGSSLNDHPIERAVADLSLQNGELRFNTDFASPDGILRAQGAAAFADGVTSFAVREGRFDNFNIAAFTGNPEQQSSLTGTFTAQGRGIGTDTPSLEASLNLAESRYSTYQINEANVAVDLADQQFTARASADLQGGQMELTGSGSLAGEVPSYRAEGRFQNIHLEELMQDAQQTSDLTGRFTLQGQGTDPETARLSATLRLDASSLNGRRIEQGTADLALRGGTLDFDVDFASTGGTLAARGEANFRGDRLSYQLREARFADLDIAAFTGDTTNTSQLTGTLTAQGSGTELATLTVDAELNLERSRFNEQVFEGGTVSLNLNRGDLDLAADVRTPEGQITLAGQGDLNAERPTFVLREGTFSGINLGAILNNPQLQTDLTGTVQLEGAGTTLTGGALDATITLQRSTINDARIVDARIAAVLQEGDLRTEAVIDFATGQAALEATAQFAGDVPGDSLMRFNAQGSLTKVNVDALTGDALYGGTAAEPDTLGALVSFDFNVAGRGTDLRTMYLEGTASSRDTQVGNAAIDRLQTDFLLDDGLLRVDTLILRANFADATGGGIIALFDPRSASDFTFSADLKNLGPLRPFINAEVMAVEEGHLEGRVFGSTSTLRADVQVDITSLVYNEYRTAGFDGRINLALDSTRTLQAGEVRAEVSYFSVPGVAIENTQLEATYDGNEVAFATDMTIDRRRDMRLSGTVDLRPGSERVQLDELNLRFDQDRWELLQPATITYGDAYRVSGFLLYSDTQQIAIDGVVDPDGQQNLGLTIESFRIGAVADLLDYQGLDGTLNGSLSLTGPADAPNMEGTLLLDLRSYDEPVGDLRLVVDYEDQRLNLDTRLAHEQGGTLTAEGYIMLDLTLASGPNEAGGLQVGTEGAAEGDISFTAAADSFAIGWVRPFLDRQTVNEIAGYLTGTVDISGSLSAPVLDGTAALREGRLGLPELGVTYRDIRAVTRFENNQVQLTEARLRAGDGRLIAEGTIDLTELTLGEFNITADAQNFLATATRDQRVVVDSDLTVRGTTREPVVRGDVQVTSADIYIGDNTSGNLQNVPLSEQDLRMLERHFGIRVAEADTTTYSFYDALDVELDIELLRNTWVRSRSNPEMNIQLLGEVDFFKAPFAEEQIFGSIEVVEGRSFIQQFGKRFDITSGTLRFNGAPTNPAMDIQAAYEVPSRAGRQQSEVTITLAVRGRLQEPEIELGSNPPMENTDIISYIATGRPAGQSFQFEGGEGDGLLGQGRDLALGQIAGIVEGVAGENLGLDVVEIQQDGLTGTTVTFGKYFTPRLYAAVRQPITYRSGINRDEFDTEFTLEYEFYRWLLARIAQRNNAIRFDLFWEYSY